MRIFIALSFVLFFLQAGFSQVKILFDASKAETAGNADWIIDADSHNLGYNPNAHIGGNESNAQKVPSPSQSNISANTHEKYWTGALSAWGVDAVKLGYHVETLPYNGRITYNDASNPQDLSKYKIFVVCEPNILFTVSEKSAMMFFLQNGGGLFMISDHDNSDRNGDGYDSPHIWNNFIQSNPVKNNSFGFRFDYEFFTETTFNIPYLPDDPLLHGNYGNVSSVAFYGGTSLTLNPSQNSSVKGIVYRNGFSNIGNTGVLCAYATFGKGKIVAIGDSSPADDGTGDSNDNLYNGWTADANGNHERLFMNATIWLSQSISGINSQVAVRENVIVSVKDNSCNFTVKTNSTNVYTINFYDSFGRKIAIETNIYPNQQYQVFFSQKGLYLYQLLRNKQTITTGKIIL